MPEIQNPNQQGGTGGGGQDMRTTLAFFGLFLLVFFGLQYYRSKKAPEPAPAQTQSQSQSQSAQQQSAAAPPAAASPAPDAGSAVAAVAAAGESTTVIENELYKITFTNRGAQVKSWILKKYTDEDGKPLDLIHQTAAAKFGYPLSLFTYDAGLRSRLASALYVASATGNLSAPNTLSFDYSAGGLLVHKSFSFDSSYVIHASVKVTQNGAPVSAMLAWPSGFGDQSTLPQYAGGMLDYSQSGKDDQIAFKKVVGGDTLRGPFDWAGVSDLYFTAIFLPDSPSDATLVSLSNTLQIPKNPKKPEPNQTESASVLGAAIGSGAGTVETRLFAGPKSLDVLGSVHAADGTNLQKVVSFGWWGIISKPLFYLLRFFHDHVIANWGWAILLLTVILNIAMLPTRIKMMQSSLKMQRIQPEMDQIKAKYAKFKATDPRKQEMQQEIFALQKREGVNMFGGCVPMLIQWPLLFGFYRMLGNVIELRHAHWLWLPDLASPDPWHILPIFVIVSMFLTQYFTPSPGVDPAQQKMMAFTMPAVFGFMMWNFGSGLSLYWACSNFIGVAQQMIMNRTGMGREIREIQLKRAQKQRGKVINARR
ncbi:membrane protein insertase YidC [Silvibacterium dinghuense]|uniref:Membrane protein insertase YidC n=1 Tax=Silvibacterium dinghuense TaxID=1560006 RepID=A0A4Q1SJE9_9BACT|nr:membrane protein insertase YidC [Silvibacterium dinghuense]RXS97761.1 membrane protein insertase YidC [Silvibacterium dinghuense]GGH01807.1 membrane protein insertase YidC [Silvibacterium dinghuense]